MSRPKNSQARSTKATDRQVIAHLGNSRFSFGSSSAAASVSPLCCVMVCAFMSVHRLERMQRFPDLIPGFRKLRRAAQGAEIAARAGQGNANFLLHRAG